MDIITVMSDLSNTPNLQWLVDKANAGIIIALALSFLFGSASIFYSKRLNTETKKQQAIEKQKSDEKIATANANAANASKNAAGANERAAAAELQSKELEIQLAKLRLAVADRFIPQFVADALIPELRKYDKKIVLVLCGESSTHEPLNFSGSLHQLFQDSGWTSTLVNQQNIRVPPPRGINIIATGKANKEIAEFIHNQFSPLGYLTTVIIQETGQADITIQVLAK